MLRHEWALKSAPGQGATFSIRVPRGEAVVEEGEGGSAPRSDRSMRGLKVLVVDNERAIQTGMSTLLGGWGCAVATAAGRSEEHTSELQSLMRISYAVFCLKKKKHRKNNSTYN